MVAVATLWFTDYGKQFTKTTLGDDRRMVDSGRRLPTFRCEFFIP